MPPTLYYKTNINYFAMNKFQYYALGVALPTLIKFCFFYINNVVMCLKFIFGEMEMRPLRGHRIFLKYIEN